MDHENDGCRDRVKPRELDETGAGPEERPQRQRGRTAGEGPPRGEQRAERAVGNRHLMYNLGGLETLFTIQRPENIAKGNDVK